MRKVGNSKDMLRVEGLSKNFGKKKVFADLSFELDNGIYGVLGPNGAGKTTFIRCICGIYKIDKSAIGFDGMEVGSKSFISNLGYLPQHFGLFKDMKVKAALEYMAALKKIPKSDVKAEIERVLKRVNLFDRIDSRVGSLSGGMMRRLGIAQALLGDPKLLIFDEPTAGLDPEERIRFKKIIAGLEKDKTVLISTHICSDIESLCNKVLVMNEGKILFNDTLEELEKKGQSYALESSESLLERGYLCLLGRESEEI